MTTKYTQEVLQDAVDNSTSVMGVLRYLDRPQAGGTHAHISRRIKAFGISTDHFTGKGWNRGKEAPNKLTAEEILVVYPSGSPRPRRSLLLRAMLDSGLTYECVRCYNDGTWLDLPITLEIDHIDGDWLNNLLGNLRFLCPNCHSQCEGTNMPHKYNTLA